MKKRCLPKYDEVDLLEFSPDMILDCNVSFDYTKIFPNKIGCYCFVEKGSGKPIYIGSATFSGSLLNVHGLNNRLRKYFNNGSNASKVQIQIQELIQNGEPINLLLWYCDIGDALKFEQESIRKHLPRLNDRGIGARKSANPIRIKELDRRSHERKKERARKLYADPNDLKKKKKCRTCGKLKTRGDFHKNQHAKDGRIGECKECRKESKESYVSLAD
jgi:excinuclease UvrABC nuclease subunit